APASLQVPRLVTADAEEAMRFQADALARGHEGVMIKSLSAPYAAGRRGSAWLKVKAARTLDLVVLAVEWGSGRRKGWLSNVQHSPHYPGGVALRFARVKGYRPDKSAAEADTIDAVRAFLPGTGIT